MIQEPLRVQLPGRASSIGMNTADRIYAVAFDDQKQANLICTNLEGLTIWTLRFPLSRHELRLADDGTAWFGIHKQLHQVSPDGRILKIVKLPCHENEEFGSFLISKEGFICSLQYRLDMSGDPRVVKLDSDGHLLWSTAIVLNQIANEGAREIGVHTEWKHQPVKPRMPENWVAIVPQPLLLSGNYLLASFAEQPHSGIGRAYCLDATDGKLLWTTEPLPISTNAIAGNGRFLIGAQGYGAFDTYLYDKAGTILTHWHSHGDYLLSEDGEFRLAEMENSLPSNMYFSILREDGSVQKGPHLPGYYTTYPAIDKEGTAAFWRNGELILIDKNLEKYVLYTDPSVPERALMSRMLLTNQGKLLFTLEKELWIVKTDLKPLAESDWPCKDGNLQGNPVI